jgi:hypothetical protein
MKLQLVWNFELENINKEEYTKEDQSIREIPI